MVWHGGALLTSLSNSGTIASKTNSPGLLTVSGTFAQSSTGILGIELGGTSAGTTYDQIAVSGAATLGGTLNVDLVNGFAPTVGETFKILTRGSGSGTFSSLTSSDPGLTYSVAYNSTYAQITIITVPEPATGTLLFLSALGLGLSVIRCQILRRETV
jgi:hypothetical protein